MKTKAAMPSPLLRQIGRHTTHILACLCTAVALSLGSSANAADGARQQNLFASIYLKDEKIGHIHLTLAHDEDGELETLTAKASVSFLGVKVYEFNQHHQETWKDGELVKMTGHTDDDGKVHEVSLVRTAEEYEVEYNGKTETLPHGAFPTAPWHYKITENTLLFNITNFELLEVQVSESPDADALTIGKDRIPATRFEFTGDWKANLWFDGSKSFLQGEYNIAGRQVRVVLDP